MTLTEKIIAKACDRPSVSPNDNVWVKTDVLMTHDVCGPGTIGNFYKEFGPKAKVGSLIYNWRLVSTSFNDVSAHEKEETQSLKSLRYPEKI